MFDQALQHFEAGRWDEAEACCGRILNQTPRDFVALRLLGRIRIRQGRFDQAAFFLAAALGTGSLPPAEILATINDLVTAELAQHNFDAAIEHCRRALAMQPGHAGTLHTLGTALYGAGRFHEASEVYREGLAVLPGSAGMHNNLGETLRALGHFEAAAESYRRAIALRPGWASPYHNLGHVLCVLDRAEEAAECYRQALAHHPDDADTIIGLASAQRSLRHFEEACALYRQALRIRPDDAFALFGLGAALLGLFRHAEAIPPLQRAAQLRPDHADTRLALGNALLGDNRHEEAVHEYREGRTLRPGAAELVQNEGFALLGMGAWAEGWRGLEARFDVPMGAPLLNLPSELPIWHGDTDIAGKTILLQSEQGLGDTILAARYVPMVASLGARVVLRVQPPLGRLLADLPGADMVLTTHDEPPRADIACPLMSLPLAFGTEVESIPAQVPYLRTPPLYRLLWQTLLGSRRRPRVGIAWHGRQHLPYRSMPLEKLAPLLQRTDLEFHGLQVEMPAQDSEWLAANPLLIDHRADQKHFADTAAIIDELDLVITIDTAVAHVAGALARPVWIMLPHSADFRWLLDRDDSPWYPTARLFRQRRPQEWEPVVAAVAQALDLLMPPSRDAGLPGRTGVC